MIKLDLKSDDRPILYSYFERTADVLLANYERSKEQGSSDDVGRNREYFCETFLKRSLPPSLSLKRGEIIDHKGNRTGQLEVIIIRDDCPIFTIGVADNVPIEGVFGVIEVKSNLSREKLCEALNTLRNVKNLNIHRSEGMLYISGGFVLDRPLRCIFAYEGATFNTLKDELSKSGNENVVDFICVLNRGALIRKNLILTWEEEEDYSEIIGKAASLGIFYHHLVSYATGFIGRSLDLQVYFQPYNKWTE